VSDRGAEVFHTIQVLARESARRNTDLLLRLYVHERFLARLARSRYSEQFVLKGGILLAVLDLRRATNDADVLARGFTIAEEPLRTAVIEIVQIDLDDGVEFDLSEVDIEEIREGSSYEGLRVGIKALVGGARVKLKVDASAGDVVAPQVVTVEPMLGGERFVLSAYSLEYLLAEKIETIVSRGDANTRVRDFADIALIAASRKFEFEAFAQALRATMANRQTELVPVADVLRDFAQLRQAQWARYLVESQLDRSLPSELRDVVGLVERFVDPVLSGEPDAGMAWSPDLLRWDDG
jgi:predicted nucleotidyltransferase component of viral defense system